MALTVVSWNVLAQAYVRPELYGHVEPRAMEAEARRARVIERVAQDDADVVALQEADADLCAALKRRTMADRHVAFAKKGGDKPDGCALVVKTELVMAPLAALSYDDGTGHVAQLMRIEGPSGPLVVANTHLKWDPPGTPAMHRVGLAQADALLAHLIEIGANDGACVVCGDLNVGADDDVIRLFAAAGFRDAHASSTAPTCIANGKAKRVDFILASGVDVAGREHAPLLRDDDVLPSLEEPSDHVPIRAVLT